MTLSPFRYDELGWVVLVPLFFSSYELGPKRTEGKDAEMERRLCFDTPMSTNVVL